MLSMIGLGTQLTTLNPFIRNYYEHLRGDKLEDAWMMAKVSISNNDLMIDTSNQELAKDDLSEEERERAIETKQDLEYQNVTNELIVEILDENRLKEAKKNAKNNNVFK